jgi:hypothetical protein
MSTGGPLQEWDEFDFLAAGGILITSGSVVASLFPACRKIEILFPIAIGVAMMAIAAFGARHGDGAATRGKLESAEVSAGDGRPAMWSC